MVALIETLKGTDRHSTSRWWPHPFPEYQPGDNAGSGKSMTFGPAVTPYYTPSKSGLLMLGFCMQEHGIDGMDGLYLTNARRDRFQKFEQTDGGIHQVIYNGYSTSGWFSGNGGHFHIGHLYNPPQEARQVIAVQDIIGTWAGAPRASTFNREPVDLVNLRGDNAQSLVFIFDDVLSAPRDIKCTTVAQAYTTRQSGNPSWTHDTPNANDYLIDFLVYGTGGNSSEHQLIYETEQSGQVAYYEHTWGNQDADIPSGNWFGLPSDGSYSTSDWIGITGSIRPRSGSTTTISWARNEGYAGLHPMFAHVSFVVTGP